MRTLTALSIVAAITAATNFYPKTMEITDISDDTVTLETATGYAYKMSGSEDYEVGDLVSLIMSDNGTPDDIIDDIIIASSYSGFTK